MDEEKRKIKLMGMDAEVSIHLEHLDVHVNIKFPEMTLDEQKLRHLRPIVMQHPMRQTKVNFHDDRIEFIYSSSNRTRGDVTEEFEKPLLSIDEIERVGEKINEAYPTLDDFLKEVKQHETRHKNAEKNKIAGQAGRRADAHVHVLRQYSSKLVDALNSKPELMHVQNEINAVIGLTRVKFENELRNQMLAAALEKSELDNEQRGR